MNRGSAVAIIEARMASSRLPGKVLLDIGGVTAIGQLIRRLNVVAGIGEIIVATTVNPFDDELESALRSDRVRVHRGSEEDVLLRIADAARSSSYDRVVSVTADCPLLDPGLVSELLEISATGGFDFVSNCITRSFPDGMDCSVVSKTALLTADALAKAPLEREHTMLYIRSNLSHFTHRSVEAEGSLRWPELGLTLDTPEDYEFLSVVVSKFDRDHIPSCADIVQLLRKHPELTQINASVERKGDA